jgi:hypothetical protein
VEIGRQNIVILFWKESGRAVSFLGIQKSEPDICIVFSLAHHLQCNKSSKSHLKCTEAGVLVRKFTQLTRSAKPSRLTPGISSCSVESAASQPAKAKSNLSQYTVAGLD